jgi:hypothetical protein
MGHTYCETIANLCSRKSSTSRRCGGNEPFICTKRTVYRAVLGTRHGTISRIGRGTSNRGKFCPIFASVTDCSYVSFQDAYILATLLGHPRTTLESASFALQIYDRVRRPFANKVAEFSRLSGQYYTLKFEGVDFDDITGQELQDQLRNLGEALAEVWKWSWTTTLDEAAESAIRMLTCSDTFK